MKSIELGKHDVYGEVYDLIAVFGRYPNNALGVSITSVDGLPIATASVNVVGESEKLAEGQFFLKDYSENEYVPVWMGKHFVPVWPPIAAIAGFEILYAWRILKPEEVGKVYAKTCDSCERWFAAEKGVVYCPNCRKRE